MATQFYRLEYPSTTDYYRSTGGAITELPVDYAWMNNEPLAGVRATVAGAQSGGHAEDGTLFIADENDATSAIGNRAHQAIAVSLDTLDDLIRRPIAVPDRKDGSTGGSPVASVTILAAEMVWLGPGGTEYATLFQITDGDGNEIIDSSGVTCVVTAANPPPGDGTLVEGFAPGAVQLTIVPSIPIATSYRIHYAKKGSLAELPRDAITRLAIGGRAEIDGGVRKQLKNLHGNSLDWDAAWTSTIYDAARGGLNERYNRQSSPSFGGDMPDTGVTDTLDADGAGGWIRREGPAVTVYIPDDNYDPYWDAMGASWKAVMQEPASAALPTAHHSGFVYLGGDYVVDPAASVSHNFGGTIAAFLHYGAARMGAASATYASAYTYLPYDGACSVGYDGGSSELYLDVSSPLQFTDGATYTDMVTGLDVVDVYNTASGNHQSFMVYRIKSQTRIWLRRLDGTKPGNLGTYAATLRWHLFKTGIGDGAAEHHNYDSAEASRLYGMTLIGPREHGTIAGPGAGSTTQSYGLNVYAGINTSSGARLFQSGYVPKDITSEESAPLVTAFLSAGGSWTMSDLTLTNGDVTGSVAFQDVVDFSDDVTMDNLDIAGDVSNSGSPVIFIDSITMRTGEDIKVQGTGAVVTPHIESITPGVTDISVDSSLVGTGTFSITMYSLVTDRLKAIPAGLGYIGVADDMIFGIGKSLSVDSVGTITATFLDVTTPIKGELRKVNFERKAYTAATLPATVAVDMDDGSMVDVVITTASTSTLDIEVALADVVPGGVYWIVARWAAGGGTNVTVDVTGSGGLSVKVYDMDGVIAASGITVAGSTGDEMVIFRAVCTYAGTGTTKILLATQVGSNN